MTSNVIQSLWIGDRLGSMQQLAIRSFLHHGHEFHLYLQGECAGVPPGTTIRDSRDILANDPIHRYQKGYGRGSPSLFSNLFRSALLFRLGGWWVDMDVIALKPFRFAGDYVLGMARSSRGRPRVAAGVIHVPAESELMRRCLDHLRNTDLGRARWGEVGPSLLGRKAAELRMEEAMQPPEVFYPVDAPDFWRCIRPGQALPDATAVHLWAQLWRHYAINPDGRFPETSMYEQLIATYLPEKLLEDRPPVNVSAAILRSVPGRISAGLWFWSRRLRRRFRRLRALPQKT
jgi:hypothetical protein